MLTLSYGFKKPQSGDAGSLWFPALEDNFQNLNDHSHDGVDSAKLATAALDATTQAISSASWSATSGGTYRQQVTLPGGLQYDDISITVRNSSSGDVYHLSIEKIDSTNYYVYINDNTISLTAMYGI